MLTSDGHLPADGYAVTRRPDNDYTMALLRCPTCKRLYTASRILQVDTQAVWAACGWCDTNGRVRMRDRAFDQAERQPHCYDIVEEPRGNHNSDR